MHGGQKIEPTTKFMQVEVDAKCLQPNLVGMASPVLKIIATITFCQISLLNHNVLSLLS